MGSHRSDVGPPTFSHPLPLHNPPAPHLQDTPAQWWPWPTGQTQRCHPLQEASGLGTLFLLHLLLNGWFCACMLSLFSHVQRCATLWTVACQVPLSLEFSRQEYWIGLPCPPPGDLPGIELVSLLSAALAGRFFYNYYHCASMNLLKFHIIHSITRWNLIRFYWLFLHKHSWRQRWTPANVASILLSSSSWEPRTITNMLGSRSHKASQKQIVSLPCTRDYSKHFA